MSRPNHCPLPPLTRLMQIGLAWALLIGTAGCASRTPTAVTGTPSVTNSATTAATATSTATRSLTPRPAGTQPVWGDFLPPQLTPVTPIPPPLTGLVVPDEVQVLVVAGVDRASPYTGRTDALTLVIYHPRLARASLVSVPPDLFGYIPGYTMQRMHTAYALGGPRQLTSAMEYNLGLKPDSYAFFNLDDFTNLIDDLGGINVNVLDNIRPYCEGIPPGTVLLDGEKALCFMRLRLGADEYSRNRRQQELLRSVFLRLVDGGNLIRLPSLYDAYRDRIETNLTRVEILNEIPLALKLGDPQRVGYFMLSENELSTWQISEEPPASVFLPVRPALMQVMQRAIDFVTTPSPLSDVVITLEYELTISPTPTRTFTMTPTPTSTNTPTVTRTPTRTNTPVPSQTFTRTVTLTRTATNTVTITPTRTPTPAPIP